MTPLGPNQFPSLASPRRIAIVGECYGADEARLQRPFAGSSGHLLNATLSSVGLSREECFVGNVVPVRPVANDFSTLDWAGELVQAGIAQLLNDLRAFSPHVIVTLGNVPLHLFRHGNTPPPRTKTGYQWQSRVTVWRGSVFLSSPQLFGEQPQPCEVPACVARNGETSHENESPLAGNSEILIKPCDPGAGSSPLLRWKVLATLHPAFVLRAWPKLFDLRQDLRKAREEGASPAHHDPLAEIAMAWGPVAEGAAADTVNP